MPFSRDPHFVARGSSLTDLAQSVQTEQHSRMAVYGLGGVGKTQIAVEFAHSFREDNPHVAVLWVYAGNADRFRESYRQIGQAFRLVLPDDPKADVTKFVCEHLSDYRNGRWLLIVDNADDTSLTDTVPTSAPTSAAFNIMRYIPQTKSCVVLVTARDERVACDLAANWSEPLKVEPMDLDTASTLLTHKLGQSKLRTDDESTLLEELGFLPLAITQAAAYMRRYKVDTTKYLQRFREQPHYMMDSMLSRTGYIDTRRDDEQPSAVYAAFSLSFHRVSQEDPTAARLLKLMSCFDRQSIPSTLFYATEPPGDTALVFPIIEKDFDESIGTLISLALVNPDEGNTAYTLRRLVRLASRKHLMSDKDGKATITEATYLLLRLAAPGGNSCDPSELKELFPHGQAVIEDRLFPDSGNFPRAQLLVALCIHLSLLGQQTRAMEYAGEAYETIKATKGDIDVETIDSGVTLAQICTTTGHIHRSEEILRDMLSCTMSAFADELDMAAPVTHYLARVLFDQSGTKNREAERLTHSIIERIRLEARATMSDSTRFCAVKMFMLLQDILIWRLDNMEEYNAETRSAETDSGVMAVVKDCARMIVEQVKEMHSLDKLTHEAVATVHSSLSILHACELQIDKAELDSRRLACANLKHCWMDQYQPRRELMLDGLNHALRALGSAEETLESFAARHEACTLALHGCRIHPFDDDLDI